MLRLNFSKPELEELKSKIFLSERQERIIEYRLRDVSRDKMADLEKCDKSTIDREIKRIAEKIMKVLWQFFAIKIDKKSRVTNPFFVVQLNQKGRISMKCSNLYFYGWYCLKCNGGFSWKGEIY